MEMNQEARTWGMVAHLSTFAGYVIPFGNVVGPLVVLTAKKEHPFVTDQAKEALNFQITILLLSMVCIVLVFVIIGIFLLMALLLFDLIVTVMACLAANRGEAYRYPFSLRLVK
ncbi:MAG: DUF4870 domain-containing protein [Planctomycetes bacterium]|nr:DUF4870 domain-containing protein [Planctomycetota bacterium]